MRLGQLDPRRSSARQDVTTNTKKAQPGNYSAFKAEPPPDVLQQLADLARRMFDAEREVAEAEAKATAKKAALKEIAEKDIPELMAKVGLDEYRTTTGLRIKIRADVRGNITAENRPAAIAWLDSHGHGGLVKRKVFIDFAREDEKRAKALVERLRKQFENVGEDYAVHPQTLLGWAREQLREGEDFPLTLFGLEQYRKAVIDTKTNVG